jgi:hypothetical protein
MIRAHRQQLTISFQHALQRGQHRTQACREQGRDRGREHEQREEDRDCGVQRERENDGAPGEIVRVREDAGCCERDVCVDEGVCVSWVSQLKVVYEGKSYAPRQMHPSTVGKRYGPGPFLARMKRKNAVPKKMKMPIITHGCIIQRDQ